MDDSLIPQTPTEWFDWLSNEEIKTRKAFLIKPALLISSYRQEIFTTRDYEGREILELLQNASDQAREAEVPGRVVIELLQEGLVVANSGAAFSIDGVKSLEVAYLSSKPYKRRQYIGNKGLGFRSVLNWTHSPIILSGALGLAYSKQVSKRVLNELLVESLELTELVAEQRGESDTLVIPVLPFPGYNERGAIDALIEDEAARRLLDRCSAWRQEGYTTAIGMPFTEPEFFDAAYDQIEALRPEVLLFVDHLDEVRFLVPEKEERVWLQDGDDYASMVLENQEPLGIWQVHRTQGEVPDDQLDEDQKSPLSYELIVAVPEVEKLDELQVSPLFSHFPTTITLPLPVVCHATLELDQSRNHIQQRHSNHFVFERLAEFLADVAEKRAQVYPSGVKAGFRMLMPLETYSNDFKREEFPQQLVKEATQREIVPTLGGHAMLAENVRSLPGADDSWLPVLGFEEIVPVSSKKEQEFFDDLGVEGLEFDEFRNRLLAVGELSIDQRADLIAGLIEHEIYPEAHTSSLLLAPENERIPDHATVFIAPHGDTVPSLPKWVTLWFLDDGLRQKLMLSLRVKEVRELQSKLSSFGVREYSLAQLIRRLVATANQRKKQQPDSAALIERELLSLVFAFFLDEGISGNRPAFPGRTSLPLMNQAGETVAADTLYMGGGYGAHGNIMQGLYGGWSPEKLIVEPNSLGLTASDSVLQEFLKWVGVAVWPRETTLDKHDSDYLNHVLDRISYPALFEEYVVESQSEIGRVSLDSIKSLDGLEEILEHADPVAITAWLALDTRATDWSRKRADHANLTTLQGYDRNRRKYSGSLPGYVYWRIESTEWLLDKDRNKLRPKDCVFGERAIEALFPKPARPEIEALKPYGIEERDLVVGWRRGGVITSLAELDLEDIYTRLYELPERQPKGKSARSLYRWLLEAIDSALGDGGIARERFFSEGRMWGRQGDTVDYFSMTELFHADSDGLPAALLDRLKIVDLPHRVGSEKVKRVFGIDSIDRMAIMQKVISHHLVNDLNSEFQEAKPFFFLLRTSQSSQTQYLSTLKKLSLKVCSELHTKMEYHGEIFDFDLPIWGWLIEKDVLYVRSDPTELVDSTSDLLADAIGAAIASIFRIGEGGEFARMFLCRPKNRKSLLSKMRGETADEDMEKIIEEFGQGTVEGRISMLPKVGPIEEPKPAGTDGPEPDSDSELESTADFQQDSQEVNPGPDIIDPLTIEPIEHHPQAAPDRQKIRIQRIGDRVSGHTITHRVSDANFVERKVMEIEESFLPARYPLRVGHLTGSEAPGCDILSFANAEDRDAFKSGDNRDFKKVVRFIEVKGRKHEGAEIELRGNAKDAAVKYGKRYFLYRLSKSEGADYTLSILRDPIASEEALEASVYVHLNRSTEMEEYDISGGILPNKFRNNE